MLRLGGARAVHVLRSGCYVKGVPVVTAVPACASRIQRRRMGVAPRANSQVHPGSTTTVSVGPPGKEHPHLTWRAAIDYKYVRDNLPAVAANIAKRKASADPSRVIALYEEYMVMKQAVEAKLQARNASAAAMKGKLSEEERAKLVAEGKALKEELAVLEAALDAKEVLLQQEGQRLPNDTHPAVPEGGEANAVLLREVGAKRAFDFEHKDHVALGEALGLFDFDAAGKASGSRFVYLKGAAALLELALVQWAMSRAVARGFVPYATPDLVRAPSVEKCGFQPRAENTQVYSIEGSDLCLTGTAEIPLGAVYMDETLPEQQLPIKMCGFGHCFRTEAGAAGAATRGLYRLHQFSKVELFIIATPEQSDAIHDELLEFETALFTELGLHFKVLDMPTYDLGAPAYRKFDVEAWMPGLDRYGEISSASNCTDFQSRRLNIRYRPAGGGEGGKKPALRFAHTLNATACAVPRMLIAILENNQQADGSVVVPEALRPFLGGMEKIGPPPAKAAKAAAGDGGAGGGEGGEGGKKGGGGKGKK